MGHLTDTEAPAQPRTAVPYGRAALGYVVCSVLGGAYVAFWFRHGIFSPDEYGTWDGFLKNLRLFVPMALICCLPTFLLLRWYLHKDARETPFSFAFMWAACASGVFVLFVYPVIDDIKVLALMLMVATIPGAIVGLLYYWIEQAGRTEAA